MLSPIEFNIWLKRQIEIIGTQKKAAELWGVSTAFLSEIVRNTKAPSEKLLRAIGYERVVFYRRKDEQP